MLRRNGYVGKESRTRYIMWNCVFTISCISCSRILTFSCISCFLVFLVFLYFMFSCTSCVLVFLVFLYFLCSYMLHPVYFMFSCFHVIWHEPDIKDSFLVRHKCKYSIGYIYIYIYIFFFFVFDELNVSHFSTSARHQAPAVYMKTRKHEITRLGWHDMHFSFSCFLCNCFPPT